MTPLELALQTEVDGKAYYLKQAKTTDDVQLQKLFSMLADDEEKHYQIVSEMIKGQYRLMESNTLANVKTVFADKLAANETFQVEIDNIEAYEQAVKFEDDSIALYKDLAKSAKSSVEEELFRELVREELRHRVILQNLLEAIRHPQSWVEDWEFNSKDDEY